MRVPTTRSGRAHHCSCQRAAYDASIPRILTEGRTFEWQAQYCSFKHLPNLLCVLLSHSRTSPKRQESQPLQGIGLWQGLA